MSLKKFTEYNKYSYFLNSLANDLTKFYYSKLDKKFVITNKLKSKGYDPVTTSDKAFEKFIRLKISKKFPTHQIIGEEFGHTKVKSDFAWDYRSNRWNKIFCDRKSHLEQSDLIKL